MCQLYLEQELYHTYFVLEIQPQFQMDRYGIKILENNTLNFFLPFQLRSKDGIYRYYYDLPEGKCLEKLLETGFSLEMMEGFASDLLSALDEIDEFLMDENDILLDPKGIYYSSKGRYLFIYYPGYKGNFGEALKNIGALFLKSVDYTCTDAVRRVYEFYHMVCSDNTSIRNLRGFVIAGNSLKEFKGTGCAEAEENCSRFQADSRKDEHAGKDIWHENEIEDGKEQNGNPSQWGQDKCQYGHNIAQGSTEQNTGMVIWVVIGIVCIALLGGAAICIRVFNQIPGIWIIAAALFFIVMTIGAGVIYEIVLRKKDENSEFWKPEDYISYNYNPVIRNSKGDVNESSCVTTILHETAGPAEKEPEIILKSKDLRLCGHLYISSFPVIIGKAVADAGCRIEIPTISRRHARLDYKEKIFYLTDLHSSNGTFVNGELIPSMKPVALHCGDNVIFSDVEFTFESMEETR